MKIFKTVFFLFFIALFLSAGPLFAQRKITIKLASLVPENTPWGAAINRMAAEWEKISNGEVEVIVFPNGTGGDEAEVLRKLRINQFQAGVFTSIGLNSVVPEVMSISYPFLIRNDAELEAVMAKLKPDLDTLFQKQDFITLAWANAGWIKIFSKVPVYIPGDLRKTKLGSNAEEEGFNQAFKAMGYQVVGVSLNDILIALNSNSIDSVYISPIYVAANQLFGITKNMTEINVAPLMGGILINSTTWRRIPEKYRSQFLAVSKRIEKEIASSISGLENEAIATMVRYGLNINELNTQQKQEWYDDTFKYEANLLGVSSVFNRTYYQRIKDILADYRRGR